MGAKPISKNCGILAKNRFGNNRKAGADRDSRQVLGSMTNAAGRRLASRPVIGALRAPSCRLAGDQRLQAIDFLVGEIPPCTAGKIARQLDGTKAGAD